jgi:hypothetical protein
MTEPTRIRLKKKPTSQAVVASQAVTTVAADASVPLVRFEGDRMARDVRPVRPGELSTLLEVRRSVP